MQPIGTEVQETIQIIPARVILHRDIYYTYGCGNCKANDITTPILKTPKEPTLIHGSYASAEAVAHIAVQKFVMGSPLYRQEQGGTGRASCSPGRPCPTGCSAARRTGWLSYPMLI